MWGWYPTRFTGKSLRARDQEFPSYVLLPVWPLATFIGNKTKADWTKRTSSFSNPYFNLHISCNLVTALGLINWTLSLFKNYLLNDISSFVFFFVSYLFPQTFNGNFDQNTVEKQILFSAFVARYLRFVVGSNHGGACLRVEVSGIPRSRGLIFFIAEIVQFLRNIVFDQVVEPSLTSLKRSVFVLQQHQLLNHYLFLSF